MTSLNCLILKSFINVLDGLVTDNIISNTIMYDIIIKTLEQINKKTDKEIENNVNNIDSTYIKEFNINENDDIDKIQKKTSLRWSDIEEYHNDEDEDEDEVSTLYKTTTSISNNEEDSDDLQKFNTREDYTNNYNTNNYNTNYTNTNNYNTNYNTNYKMSKYVEKCEKIITFFINNYKIDHMDSVNGVIELNLITVRVLGINIVSDDPQLFQVNCWFMRNQKCYYQDKCIANTFNLCTYAHKKYHSNVNNYIQYCCHNEKDYDVWPDNYYKCLKMKLYENDEIYDYIVNYGDNKLDFDHIMNIPQNILEWYNDIYNSFN